MLLPSSYHFNPQIKILPTTSARSSNLKIQSSFDTWHHNKTSQESNQNLAAAQPSSSSSCSSSSSKSKICSCGRRRLLATIGTALIPIHRSSASVLQPDDPMAVLNRVHPPVPDWYEEFCPFAVDKSMISYESEIAGYKSQLFANLIGKAENILEMGIGTGPNLKYYAGGTNGVRVVGVDPNRKMENYATAAAEAAGLPRTNFKFMQAVGEALPVSDASMDAVVGTLVLCSVKDVDKALQEVRRVLKPGGLYIFVEHVAAKDGTLLRLVQGVLDPLQQKVADGCHLTRQTGNSISSAGFSSVDINTVFLSSVSLTNPHSYGIACK